jgi:Flp pilus assembly protein TadD
MAPDRAASHDLLGWALHLNGNSAGAITALWKATTIDPSFAGAHYHLALAYERQGEYAGAKAAYRRVLDLDVGALAERARSGLDGLVQ